MRYVDKVVEAAFGVDVGEGQVGLRTAEPLLKASLAFKLYHHKGPKFVWQMAGCQLAFIKAQMSSAAAVLQLIAR